MATTNNLIDNDDYIKVHNMQRDVHSVVDYELSRIQNKKSLMDTQRHNAERMILLNQSHSSRLQQYLVVLLLVVLIAGLALLITFMKKYLGYTSSVLDVILFLVVGIGIISIFNTIREIHRRDEIDFSKISDKKLQSPSDFGKSSTSSDNNGERRILKTSQELCKAADCCGPGYTYRPAEFEVNGEKRANTGMCQANTV
jgi:hypothetical protein